MRTTLYQSGEALRVNGYGQPEGRQRITTVKRTTPARCPKTGCQRYEKGWTVTLNLNDAQDANAARFIREGKTRCKYEESLGENGVTQFHFPPGQCLGHRGWEEPLYVVGQRETNHDEWHHRYMEGGEALVAANERRRDIENG